MKIFLKSLYIYLLLISRCGEITDRVRVGSPPTALASTRNAQVNKPTEVLTLGSVFAFDSHHAAGLLRELHAQLWSCT